MPSVALRDLQTLDEQLCRLADDAARQFVTAKTRLHAAQARAAIIVAGVRASAARVAARGATPPVQTA